MLRDIDPDTDMGLVVAGVGGWWGIGQDYLFMTGKVTVLLKTWNISVKCQKHGISLYFLVMYIVQ